MEISIVQPDEGKELTAFGDTIQFKLWGEHSKNTVTVGLVKVLPGGGPPLHVHHREEEIYIIESGDIEVNVNGEWKKAPVGSVVFLPRDIPHQFRNAGTTTSRHWVIATPSGFEDFFQDASDIFAKGGPPDVDAIMKIAARHEVEVIGPPPGR